MLTNQIHYTTEFICSWDQLIRFYSERFSNPNEQWIFRGQKDASWKLRTTLERQVAHFKIDTNIDTNKFREGNEEYDQEVSRVLEEGFVYTNGKVRSVFELEGGLLREFKRKCHHYEMDTPKSDDIAEWLALMRHYGAPSRLLDWNYSFFVAVFFAIEEAEKDCAVWALESKWADNLVRDKFPMFKESLKKVDKITEPKIFKELLIRKPPIELSLVYPLNPFRLNQRLVVQQGVFLCPGNVSKPFEENVEAILPKFNCHNKFLKYIIKFDLEEKQKILQNLHRMNISRASLFPSLDGFAQSLRTLLVFPGLLKPEESWKEIKPSEIYKAHIRPHKRSRSFL